MVISRSSSRRVATVAMASVLGMLVVSTAALADPAAPNFQLPFPCGETWSGETYQDHSPVEAVDLNRPGDEGDPVVAAAAGKVSRAEDDGATSYGLWVEIDHGDGWTSRYGHLSGMDVRPGDQVGQGQRIGLVGGTGHATGPHLHFEERSGDRPVQVSFDGMLIHYWGTQDYTSNNSC